MREVEAVAGEGRCQESTISISITGWTGSLVTSHTLHTGQCPPADKHNFPRYLLQTGEVFQDKTNTNMFWFYPDFRTTVQAVSIPGLLPSNGTWNAAISTRKQMNKTSLYIGVQPVGPLTFPVF